MNKKIAAIIAGSVAALGSAFAAAPANAQSATLPVTLEVRPALFIRTYNDLKFVVNPNDLTGGSIVKENVTYDEAAPGTSSLPTTSRVAGATSNIVKRIPELYQVWGARESTRVEVTPSVPTLTNTTSSASTVTMSVSSQPTGSLTNTGDKEYFSAPVELSFALGQGATTLRQGTYTGGVLTISVTAP
ncbi:hypothetical protein RIVM261_061640 [Rivularia sp. IAM M-261]|nr:hypothetical protein RIVM261_061640 [Rivularia sp. IAM M-261]